MQVRMLYIAKANVASSCVHLQCAGLTQPCCKSISESKAPFLCVCCLLIQQASQISQLQSTVNNLTAQISELVGTQSPKVTEASTPTIANIHMETSADLPASNKKFKTENLLLIVNLML